MKPPKKRNPIAWLTFMCLLALCTAEGKAQVKKMSTKDLTKESTAVLHGKCSKIESQWNEDRSIIYTYVTISTEANIKGNLGSEAVLMIPGGRVDNIIYEVSETPVFVEGEEVVAFVWTNPSGKNLITGGYQGKLKIEKDEKTGKKMVIDVDLGEEEENERQGIPPGQLKKMSLEDFTAKVKGFDKPDAE